ncbi:MAG: hypothetical protein KJ950_04165 [Proteobacteria bacterium]|nr:hypothetical protein [Pseudomonadota bacterium]MBU1688460.1 hypothetical protein [Pseudomonadota bacterium]
MRYSSKLFLFAGITVSTASFILSAPNSVYAGAYLDSAHGGYNDASKTKGVLRLTGPAPGNCSHCHEQHSSIGGFAGSSSPFVLFDTLNGNSLCNTCHDASTSNGADNIAAQYSAFYTFQHAPDSAIYAAATSGTDELTCEKCHNSHVAQRTKHAIGVNTASSVLAGLTVKTVAAFGSPGIPAFGFEQLSSTSLGVNKPISYEYELCLQCHGNTLVTYGLEDIGRQINPNNFSAHPIATSGWKNSFLTSSYASALKSPWNSAANTKMYCSDCHGSGTPSDPWGPHGSQNLSLTKGSYLTDNNHDALCVTCHDVSVSAWNDAGNNDHDLAAHQSTVTAPGTGTNTKGCLACHGGIGDIQESSVHGANYVWPMDGVNNGRKSKAFLVGGDITKNYYIGTNEATDDVPGNRYCAASCHTVALGIPGTVDYPY